MTARGGYVITQRICQRSCARVEYDDQHMMTWQSAKAEAHRLAPPRHSLCPSRLPCATMAGEGEAQLERALELSDARPAEAAALLRALCLAPGAGDDVKTREAAVHALASLLAKQRDAPALRALLTELRPLFAVIPKAKTAKLVRAVIDAVATVPDTTALQARTTRAR